MATIAELKVKIGANVTDFDKKLSGIQAKMKETGKRMQSMGKTMSMAITAPLAGMAAVALKSFDTQVQAENKLRAALIANGAEVEKTMKDYKSFASELQKVSTVGDEETLQLLQMAQSMGVTGEKAKLAAKQAISLAKAQGVSVQSTIRMTAALADGDANMIKRYLPALKGIKDESKMVATANEMLAKMFGVVTAEAQDGLGPLIQLKNQMGDLMEQFGGIIAQGLKPLIDNLKEGIAWFQNLSEGTKKTIVMVGGLAAAIGPLLIVLGFLASTVLPALITGFGILIGPIGLVVAAIAGAAILIIQNWDAITQYFTSGAGSKMWDEVVNVWNKGVDAVKILVSQVTKFALKIWQEYGENIMSILNNIKKGFTAIWGSIFKTVKGYLSIIGDMFDFWGAVFTGNWEQMWYEVKSIFFKLFKIIIDSFSAGLDLILAGIGKVASLFNDEWSTSINNARDSIANFSKGLVDSAASFLGYKADVKSTTDALEQFNEAAEEAADQPAPAPAPAGGGGGGVDMTALNAVIAKSKEQRAAVDNLAKSWRDAEATAKIFGTTAGDLLTNKIQMTESAIKNSIEKWGEESNAVKNLIVQYDALKEKQVELANGSQLTAEKIGQVAQQVLGMVGQVLGGITDLITMQFESREIAMENYFTKQQEHLDNTEMSEKARANAQKKLDEDVAKTKKKFAKEKAKADKKAAIAGAIMNTALAVAGALTILPPPVGIAFAVMVGALGAAEIATIKSTPLPSFATGGIVGAPMIAMVGDAPSGPEVIAPLDKLQSMLGLGGNVELSTVIRGEDIILVTDRTKANRGYIE